MKSPLSFGRIARLLLALATASPALAVSTTTNQTFNVQAAGRLVIAADRGAIEVSTADTATLSITVNRETGRSSESKGRDLLEAHKITFEQDGNTVILKAGFPKSGSAWDRKASGLKVRYSIVVPKKFDLTLGTAGGDIEVDDIAGKLKLTTAGGSIKVAGVDGPMDANTAGGNIQVNAATGPVHAETAGGSIRLGQMGGPVKAGTAGGSVRVDSSVGPVHARATGGGIEIGKAFGSVDANATGGSITAHFVAASKDDSVLESTGGGLTVYVGEKPGFDVNAESTGGSIHSDLEMDTTRKASESSLKGKLNGGGPELKLRSVGGGINLRKQSE